MCLAPLVAILLAGATAPVQPKLEKPASSQQAPPPAACPDVSRPLDAEAGLDCAAHRTHFARAAWLAPRLNALRVRRVSLVPAYQSPGRPELPLDRTLQPYVGVQLKVDLVKPR